MTDFKAGHRPGARTISTVVLVCLVLVVVVWLHAYVNGEFIRATIASAILMACAGGVLVMVARQNRIVEALARSETQFRATFDQAAIGIAHASASGAFLRVNRKLCAMLGYTEAEMMERSFLDITHPADVPATRERMLQVLAEAGPTSSREAEKRYVRKDGTILWVTLAVALVRDDHGEPQYFVSAIQDVTERKRAEALTGLEHTVARCLAGTDSAADTLRAVIRAICELESWELGRYWRVDDAAGVLRAMEQWSVPDAEIANFLERSRGATFAPGIGWVGRTWQSGDAQWVADISGDDRLVQKTMVRETGLRAVFAFPVVSEGTIIGVFAFASREIREPDARLLAATSAIGSQVGQYLRSNEAEEGLRRFRAAMEATSDAIYLIDRASMRYIDVNESACRMVGCTREELMARGPAGVLGLPVEELAQVFDAVIEGGPATVSLELQRPRADGTYAWVELQRRAQRSAGGWLIISVVRDITERKKLEERLLQQAHYDSLTQLPNRALCYDRLRQALIQAKRKSVIAAVLFVDLDGFKAVNDTHGHGAGDQLLQRVGERITNCVRAGDTVGRIGGDEFLVILPELAGASDSSLIARKAIEALAAPFRFGGLDVSISASIGIASYPGDGDTVEMLITNADSAMFSAKESGRNTYRFFSAAA